MFINYRGITRRSVHLVGALDAALVGSVLSGEEGLSRLVGLELGDLAVGWVDWHLDGVAALLVPDDFLDVDAPSLSVDANDFTIGTLASVLGAASENLDSVALPDWDRPAVILSSKVLAQQAAHDLSLDAAWSCEVSLSGLSSLARDSCNTHKRVNTSSTK